MIKKELTKAEIANLDKVIDQVIIKIFGTEPMEELPKTAIGEKYELYGAPVK